MAITPTARGTFVVPLLCQVKHAGHPLACPLHFTVQVSSHGGVSGEGRGGEREGGRKGAERIGGVPSMTCTY